MLRRDFLKALSAVAAVPLAAPAKKALAAVKMKITDLRVVPLRVEREVGSLVDYNGNTRSYQLGGGNFIEVHTDQGLVGIGPTMPPADRDRFKSMIVGEDPFNIEAIAKRLIYGARGVRGAASVEIAIWDLIGKAADLPLYKLWGGVTDRVIPYASQLRLSTVEERVEQAQRMKSEGWKAIKLRSRFPTMKEDIRLVAEVRKAVGDDYMIMTDANMATNAGDGFLQPGTRWDFERALKTAQAYEELNLMWLEEPLPRYDYDHIAELNRLVGGLKIAGGESNHGLYEFRELLERGCYDIIQPEVMIDGPTLLRKAAVLAESMDKLCIPHVGGQLGNICAMHLVAAWPNAPVFEIFNDPPGSEMRYSNGIYENPPVFKDGYLMMPDAPGLGVTVRKDLIQA